jgi:biotin transport system substrate-specific component
MNIRIKRHLTYEIAIGGMFIALFFFASNLVPPIYLVPRIPVTLQILAVALMGGILGVRAGLFNLLALYIITIAGLPMMSSFHGGPAAFLTPTAGFIFGWVFVVLFAGLCRDIFAGRLRGKLPGRWAGTLYAALMFVFLSLGVLADYVLGAVWFDIYGGSGLGAFFATLAGFMIYLPFDIVKCVFAAGLCASFAFVPGLARLSHIR